MSFVQQDNRPDRKNVQPEIKDKAQKNRDLKGDKGKMNRLQNEQNDMRDDDRDEDSLSQ